MCRVIISVNRLFEEIFDWSFPLICENGLIECLKKDWNKIFSAVKNEEFARFLSLFTTIQWQTSSNISHFDFLLIKSKISIATAPIPRSESKNHCSIPTKCKFATSFSRIQTTIKMKLNRVNSEENYYRTLCV